MTERKRIFNAHIFSIVAIVGIVAILAMIVPELSHLTQQEDLAGGAARIPLWKSFFHHRRPSPSLPINLTKDVTSGARPNIIFILTDDQRADDQWVLNKTNSLIGEHGVTFKNFFVSLSGCCPSRATFLTGQYAHNHGVLGNTPAQNGGYSKLDHTNTLAVWLQNSGYYTMHAGKYLNGYMRDDAPTVPGSPPFEIPQGWSEWYGGGEGGYFYFYINENGNYTIYSNQTWTHADCDFHPEDGVCYKTDVLTKKAVDFIKKRAQSTDGKPFYLSISFPSPHVEVQSKTLSEDALDFQDNAFDTPGCLNNPPPPARYQDAFETLPLPIPPSFGEKEISDKPMFIKRLPPIDQNSSEASSIACSYRSRLESLLAVDEGVETIVNALKATGFYNNTIIFFTSDNGWMNGEHRIPVGKALPYEESIREPLLVEGPGIPQGLTIEKMTVNIDYAPTIVELAGAIANRVMDGKSLLPLIKDPSISWRNDFLIEAPPIGNFAVRTERYLYSEYTKSSIGAGARELYDLQSDKYELESKHNNASFFRVRYQLKQRLDILKTCSGAACWQ